MNVNLLIIITILGIIQGLAEVFPVSSSFHINIFTIFLSKFLQNKWAVKFYKIYNDGFDVVLHAGSFLAFLMFFRRNIAELIYDFYCLLMTIFNKLRKKNNADTFCKSNAFFHKIIIKFASMIYKNSSREKSKNNFSIDTLSYQVRFQHVLCSVLPIVLVTFGVFFLNLHSVFLSVFNVSLQNFQENTVYISIILSIVSAVILYLVHILRGVKLNAMLSMRDAFLVGLMQSFAMLPGMSRFGMCLIGFRLLRYDLTRAVFFSFIFSLPAIFGSIVFKLNHIQHIDLIYIIMGIGFSFLSTRIAILFALRFFQKEYSIFVITIYRITFAIVGYFLLVF